MIELQSGMFGVKVMEISMDKENMECVSHSIAKTQCRETNESDEKMPNGKAELLPLFGTNSLPQRCTTDVESGAGIAEMQCREATELYEKMLRERAELPPFFGTNWLPQCSSKTVESSEVEGVKSPGEVNAVPLEIGASSSAEWPRRCTRHAQCDSGDEQKLEPESKVKHVSFNADDGEWIERYDHETEYWAKELWSDDSDDDVPEAFRWAEGTFMSPSRRKMRMTFKPCSSSTF